MAVSSPGIGAQLTELSRIYHDRPDLINDLERYDVGGVSQNVTSSKTLNASPQHLYLKSRLYKISDLKKVVEPIEDCDPEIMCLFAKFSLIRCNYRPLILKIEENMGKRQKFCWWKGATICNCLRYCCIWVNIMSAIFFWKFKFDQIFKIFLEQFYCVINRKNRNFWFPLTITQSHKKVQVVD